MKESNNDVKEISIIIPVYNAEKTIERCIKSILNQTIFRNIEIILVDDGSTDNSLKIIEEYANNFPSNIKVIKQKNSGPSVARNNGLKNANGKYIGFIDSDDYVDPTMYETMKKEMENEEVDMVLVGRYDVLDNGKSKPIVNNKLFTGISLRENKELLSKTSTFVWDKLYKKEIIDNNNIVFPEDLEYAEDFYFLTVYKYFCKRVSVVKEPLYYYITKSEDSITNTCNERWLDIIKTLDRTNQFFIQRGEFNKYKSELLQISMGFYCRRLNALKNSNNKKMQIIFIKKFHEYFSCYFENWEKKLQSYGEKKPKRIRTNIKKIKFYVFLPNILKQIPDKIRKNNQKLKNIYRKFKMNKTYYAYCRKRHKVQEKQVLFMSYFGGNITDSPYYMMKELAKDNKFEIFVASRQPKSDKTYLHFNNIDNVKIVKVHSKEFVKLLASAKYIVNNSRMPEYVAKREGQIFMNTWHGTPLKTLGRKMNKGLKDVGNNQNQFLMSDYLLYPNEYTRKHMMRDFCLEDLFAGKVIVSGYPRNEIFFDKEAAKKLKQDMGLENKKVYVYMPTWRGNTLDTTNIKQYKEEVETILRILDEQIQDAIIFVKLHQIVMKHINLEEYQNIKNINSYYETYKFLNMADALITDYSSVFFDFANSKKEIILFMYDYEKYMCDRGMYFDIQELPFTKIYNIEDLIMHINQQKEFKPDEQYEEFLNKYCSLDSEKNSEITNDIVFRNKNNTSRTIDYGFNKKNKYKVIFCTDLSDDKKQEEFKQILENLDNNTVLAFKQKTFKNVTNTIIHRNDDKIKNYIVVPEGMSLTLSDKFFISIYRKLKIFKNKARKIYKKELDRVFPNISIIGFKNYTMDKRLKDLEKLFKGGNIK